MNSQAAKKTVTYPHLLTPKALAIAEGRYAINITEADWQSLYDYWDRVDLVDEITTNLFKQYGI